MSEEEKGLLALQNLDVALGLELPGEGVRLLARVSAADAQKQQLLQTLEDNEWNIAQVSRLLGVGRRTVYLRMRRHGIERLKPKKTRKRRQPRTMETLSEREREQLKRWKKAVRWRRQGLKLEEIGNRLGVSKERARQILKPGPLQTELGLVDPDE